MLNLEPHYSIIDAVYGMAYIAMKQSYCCMMGGLATACTRNMCGGYTQHLHPTKDR